MTWVKLDDGFWSNPKVDSVGNEAAGVYSRALSYCGCHETDGAVPDSIARYIGKAKAWERLVDAGLCEPLENGYLVPDFLEFNPSHEVLEAKREADRKRKAGS